MELEPRFPLLMAPPRGGAPREFHATSWWGSLWPDFVGLAWARLFGTTLPIRMTARSIEPETELVKPPSRGATGADIPSPRSSVLDSSASPLARSGDDAEQPLDASRQQAELPPAVARRDEAGFANQTVGAPTPPATQTPAEPAGAAALPEPKKAENTSAAAVNGALRPSDAPPQAAATPLPPGSPVAVAPASAPSTVPRARKAPKPSVAANIGERHQSGEPRNQAGRRARRRSLNPNQRSPPLPRLKRQRLSLPPRRNPTGRSHTYSAPSRPWAHLPAS